MWLMKKRYFLGEGEGEGIIRWADDFALAKIFMASRNCGVCKNSVTETFQRTAWLGFWVFDDGSERACNPLLCSF